jgi:hypothetical protein
MDPSRIAGIVSLALSVPQGLAASFQIIDRIKSKKLQVSIVSGKRTGSIASLLFVGMASCIIFGCWILFSDPFRPTTIEKIVTVEKAAPCPATSTGPATSKSGSGGTSISHSGSGDTYTLQTPTKSSK